MSFDGNTNKAIWVNGGDRKIYSLAEDARPPAPTTPASKPATEPSPLRRGAAGRSASRLRSPAPAAAEPPASELARLAGGGRAAGQRPLPPDWRRGVFMEIYVRAYQDSDGDGIGDLQGLTSRLDYLQSLGVSGAVADADHAQRRSGPRLRRDRLPGDRARLRHAG